MKNLKIVIASLVSIFSLISSHAQIGFGTATPNSSLDVRGGVALSVQSFTSDLALGITHHTLLFKGISATTVTLPDATACRGRIYYIKNASASSPVPVVTLTPAAGQTIGGYPMAFLDEAFEIVQLVSNGTGWETYGSSAPIRVSGTVSNAWYQGGNTLASLKTLGTTSSIDMAFLTRGSERMRITSAGFLGIGTIPETRFHLVNENDDAANDYKLDDYGTTNTGGFFVRKSRGTLAVPADLQSGDLIAQLRFYGRQNGIMNRQSGAGIDAYYLGSGITNVTDARIFTSGSEQMRLDGSGNSAVGTTTFNAMAERMVVDANDTYSYNVISGKGSIDNYLQLNIRNASGGSNASSDIVATADNGNESDDYIDMGINSGGFSNVTYPNISGVSTSYLYSTGDQLTIGNGSPGYDLVYFTNGYTLANERMRVTAAGNIGIGTSTPADKLSVAGIVAPFDNSLYPVGRSGARWTEVWSVNGVIQTSDERLKTSIRPFSFSLNKLNTLNAVSYHWKSDPNGRLKIGFLAQEVKQVVPEVVVTDDVAGTLGINYTQMVPVLISVIQDQQQLLQKLSAELKTLEEQ